MVGDIYRVGDKYWAVQTEEREGRRDSYAAFSIIVSEIEKEDILIPSGLVDPYAECGLLLGMRILAKRIKPSILKRTGRNVDPYLPIFGCTWNTLCNDKSTLGFDYSVRRGRKDIHDYIFKISREMGW